MPAGLDILYRCNVTWSLLGQTCINSFFFRSKSTAPSTTIPAEMTRIHDDIQNKIHSGFRDQMSNQVQLVASVLVNLNGSNFYEDVRSYVGQNGNIIAVSMPTTLAVVVGWYTAFRGRRVHGRTYIPGIPQNQVTGNDVSTAYLSGLASKLNNIINWFGDGGSSTDCWMVCYSRKNGVTTNPGPPPFLVYSPLAGVPITHYVVDLPLGTQRHRKEGRGI